MALGCAYRTVVLQWYRLGIGVVHYRTAALVQDTPIQTPSGALVTHRRDGDVRLSLWGHARR